MYKPCSLPTCQDDSRRQQALFSKLACPARHVGLEPEDVSQLRLVGLAPHPGPIRYLDRLGGGTTA
jgi:hypothetical protein